MKRKFAPLRFGTSGLRDTVENMTDMECYINSRGFLAYLASIGEFAPRCVVAIGGDRRPSSPRIKRAVAAAIRDTGGRVDDQGLVSSPSLASFAMQRGIPSIMVTGSHIPADRNGIKFTKKTGEVLKSDEGGILACVARERKKVSETASLDGMFDEVGMFREEPAARAGRLLKAAGHVGAAMSEYIGRYRDVFGPTPYPEPTRIFLYQHSAVARDAAKEIFESLGAAVVAPEGAVKISYVDEGGERREEAVPLRSTRFVPVDTESVSQRTMAIFANMMNESGLDIGITMDGDSDRPLLVYRIYRGGSPTDEVAYVTGDILGLLCVLALEEMGVEINAVAIPVSANDAIATVLEEKGVEITQTKIGSPYVIAAMAESIERHQPDRFPVWSVFSWESNGGFLTGSDLTINGRVLKALPTRDSILPLVAVIMMARRRGVPVSDLLRELPPRYTHADREKDFPNERSRAIIAALSPETHGCSLVEFRDGKAVVTSAGGETKEAGPESEFHRIRDKLREFFTPADGFGDIMKINFIDGVRIFFSNGEISHLRPSGNAPEFRNYAIAGSPERAREIVEIGLRKIIPAMAEKLA